jgi:uncharacterized protein YbjT (DUF2867 family)
MILITTAGKVGAEAARLLAPREEPVRVLVRDPEKATALAEAGVDVAAGDLGVPATIDAAMHGVSVNPAHRGAASLIRRAVPPVPRPRASASRTPTLHPARAAQVAM